MLISYKKPKGRFFIVGKPGGSPAVTRHISINVSGGLGTLYIDGNAVTLDADNTWEADIPDGTQITMQMSVDSDHEMCCWYDPNGVIPEWQDDYGWCYTNPATITVSGDYVINTQIDTYYNLTVVADPTKYTLKVNDTVYSTDYHGRKLGGNCEQLVCIPETGYQFNGWGTTTVDAGGWWCYPFDEVITPDVTAVGVQYNISIQSSDNNYGYIEVDGVSGDYTATLNAGTQLSLRAVPNNITGDGREVEFSEWAGNNYDFDNPTTYTVSGDDTITANFHIERYIYVTVDSSKYTIFREEFQTMTQDFTDAVISGGCKEYEVIPETGYQFDGWLIDGVLDSDTSNPRYFCDEGYDYTVEPSVSAATPAQPNDEIWYTSTDGQVVTPFSVDFGTGITVTSNTYADGKGVIKLSGNATTIGNNAFNSCTTLETINIPSSVTSIGNQSFRSCSGLTTIDIPNSVTSIGSQTFQDCIGLTSITIGSGLTAIGGYDFSGCTGLISVNIPNTITEIGRQAFHNCTSLTSITFGTGLTNMVYGCFEGCTGLTTIDIPDNVTFIGHYAFSGCIGLTSVTIPDNVTSIGNYVFSSCSGLTSVTIGSGITSIGDSAFSGNSGLTSVTCEATTPPSLGTSAFRNTNDCPIYVPAESVTAYQGASRWSSYSSRIQAIP